MKIAGIIAEYNPFHNGHLYQIEKTKKELNTDYIIAVMSGNFVMRGEPALYNKFIRAKAAANSGADLVIELPTPYALSSSEYFARGGVSILNSLNAVSYLSFGSECGNIDELTDIAKNLNKREVMEKIRENQKKGIPVFSAMAEEFDDYKKEILKEPNNILAINYLKAIEELKSDIIPYTVARVKTGYNDKKGIDGFASATGIREMLFERKDISPYIPEEVADLIKEETPVFEEEFDKVLSYILRVKKKEEFLKYGDVSEGLENLISEAAKECYGVKNTAAYIKSKRYAYTRIKRILFNIILDIDKNEREELPSYARVLAFNEKGRKLMSYLNKVSNIPLITNPSKSMYEKYPMLSTDKKAVDIYSIICQNKGGNSKGILL